MQEALETQAHSIATLFLIVPIKVRIKSHWINLGPKPNLEIAIVAKEWNTLINWAWSQRKMKELLLEKGNGMLAEQKKKRWS